MTNRVCDIVRELTGANFRPDVQIADYLSEVNLELLRHYIFTSRAPAGKKSSVDLLKSFCEAFVPGATENRFVVIATYGHGKSHFALTLANFFGREKDSVESVEIQKALHHAISDEDFGTYGFIEDFKKTHKPYIILILRGDEPNDLPTKVYRALEEALPDGEELPFWFQVAEKWLEGKGKKHRTEVDKYLRENGLDLDLDSLLSRVKGCDASVHDICVGLVEEISGVREPFAQGLGLAEVIKWIVDNKCGNEKPYDGLLILFDEFSTFILNYSRSPVRGSPLQDLLNGIRERPERSAFIAFAQHDPDEVARGTTQGLPFDLIKKELERLPHSRRYQLHSSLEEVLESYLQKKNEAWSALLKENKAFSKGLDQATMKAWETFSLRYSQELKWSLVQFENMVTRGCYPLHPFTTSLLCSVDLQSTANPRSILGFVQEAIEKHFNDPVITEARPTWVWAISLVDYFKDMLSEDHLQNYMGALSLLNQADEAESDAVLKAMLLVIVGNVSTKKLGYENTVAEISGLSSTRSDSSLMQLTERSIIRKDGYTGYYTIAPTGWGKDGEKIIKMKLQQLTLDAKTIEDIRDDLENLGLGHLAISMGWGHPDDWYAKQILVTRTMLTSDYLKGVIRRYIRWSLNAPMKPNARGLVVWLLAQDESDVDWYQSQVSQLIKDVNPEESTPLPLVLARPTIPNTELIERLKRYTALKQFSQTERTQAQEAWYKDALAQAKANLEKALVIHMKSNVQFEVSVQFKRRLDSIRAINIDSVMSEIFSLAYLHGVKQWFEQYKFESSAMRNAVSSVCTKIIQNGKIEQGDIDNKGPARDIVGRYLINLWHILDRNGRPIKAPPNSPIQKGWDLLEESFPTGNPSTNARAILEILLNPPYGYDWNELALLITIWWAFYRYDLEVTGDWPICAIKSTLKPSEMIQKMAGSSIRRREDPAGEVRNIVEDVRSGKSCSRTEALKQIGTLEEFAKRDAIEPAFKGSIIEALDRLKAALNLVDEYDKQANLILNDISKDDLNTIISCLSRVKKLPALELVCSQMPNPEEIADKAHERINISVEQFCSKYNSLKQIEDYTNNLNQLRALEKILDKHQLTTGIGKINKSIEDLDNAKKELDEKLHQEGKRKEQELLVRALSIKDSVSELRQSLDKLNSLIPQKGIETLLAQKQEALSQELKRLEQFANSFSDELDKASDTKLVSKLRDKAIELRSRYDDTEMNAIVAYGIDRADRLIRIFNEVTQFKQNRSTKPEDFAQAVDGIKNIATSNLEYLSDLQKAAIENVVKGVEDDLVKQRLLARNKLDSLKDDLNGGVSPKKINERLESEGITWAFLEDDNIAILRELRGEVQKRIEQAKVEKEAKEREQQEIQHHKDFVKGLSVHRPISELRSGIEKLDSMVPHPVVKPLFEQKRQEIDAELDRLKNLPGMLSLQLDNTTNRNSVDACKSEGLRSRDRCDEKETLEQLDSVLERCKELVNYIEKVDNIKVRVRTTPIDFERDKVDLKEAETNSSEYLSDTHRNIAKKAIADIETALSAKQSETMKQLTRLEKTLDEEKSASNIQRDLEGTDWSFLPSTSSDSLERLKRQVQERIDSDESQQVELHFRKIRDKTLRKKCLETLQSLVEEDL